MLQLGLAQTREKARALIMAGLVEVHGAQIAKPGHLIMPSAQITLKQSSLPFVSRGGIKLDKALEKFKVNVQGKTILDVGASTGGFTDCLLQNGAAKVIAVDVGYGQLDWKLRQDVRVEIMEKCNIRSLDPTALKEPIQGAVIDVSFISLKLVVPVVSRLIQPDAFIIALIKPQFEVGKGKVGKGGVVRDPNLHDQVLKELCAFFENMHWKIWGPIDSPLLGPKGNKEFLVYLTHVEQPSELKNNQMI